MLIAILLCLQVQTPQDTLRLSLAQALVRARQVNLATAVERAEARSARQDVLKATRALLPSLQVDVQGYRTTDPVAAFGGRLRQARFGQADFGLDALNRPDPFSNWTASATAQIPLIVPEGWYGHRAARRAADARAAVADRTAGTVRFRVIQAYWGTVLAYGQVAALDTALAATRAHADQAEALRAQGLVTGLDARLARVRAAETEAQRLTAASEAANALSALQMLLLLPDDALVLITDSLVVPVTDSCAEVDCDTVHRGDVSAANLGVAAASNAVSGAWASNLPFLGAFATLAHHSANAPWGSGSGDWTVGIALTWRPFQALAGLGAVRQARAQYDAAVARRKAAAQQAALEVFQATRRREVARARVSVAAQAVDDAAEALDQAELRYRTGISGITELLDVQAATTSADLNLLAARYDLLVAQAALDLAYGVYDR